MFRSIEYKLVIFLGVLICAVAAATFFFISGKVWYAVLSCLIVLWALMKLRKHYSKFNSNILFLLNALDNGDYSFHFSETRLSRREKELNSMLNRIKDILAKARNEVISNEKFLGLIVETVTTGIVIIDDRGIVRTVNRAATGLLGLPVFTHIKQLAVIDESFPEMMAGLTTDDRLQLGIPNEREHIQVSVRMSRINLRGEDLRIITLNNIGSELEAKEMESWIRLIRVMTHEIMNSIAPISSLSDTMLGLMGDCEEPDRALKENTVEAFRTINTTARGLLLFVDSYRRFTAVPRPDARSFGVQDLVDKAVSLVVPGNAGISVEVTSDTQGPILEGDPDQIGQVLINIIKNAVEAVRKSGGGDIRIDISTGRRHIEVKNNGEPIPGDILPHIFIPFYTTKDSGSGVGLSLSRYIMRLHGGNLNHRTEGIWTVFSLVFP